MRPYFLPIAFIPFCKALNTFFSSLTIEGNQPQNSADFKEESKTQMINATGKPKMLMLFTSKYAMYKQKKFIPKVIGVSIRVEMAAYAADSFNWAI